MLRNFLFVFRILWNLEHTKEMLIWSDSAKDSKIWSSNSEGRDRREQRVIAWNEEKKAFLLLEFHFQKYYQNTQISYVDLSAWWIGSSLDSNFLELFFRVWLDFFLRGARCWGWWCCRAITRCFFCLNKCTTAQIWYARHYTRSWEMSDRQIDRQKLSACHWLLRFFFLSRALLPCGTLFRLFYMTIIVFLLYMATSPMHRSISRPLRKLASLQWARMHESIMLLQ